MGCIRVIFRINLCILSYLGFEMSAEGLPGKRSYSPGSDLPIPEPPRPLNGTLSKPDLKPRVHGQHQLGSLNPNSQRRDRRPHFVLRSDPNHCFDNSWTKQSLPLVTRQPSDPQKCPRISDRPQLHKVRRQALKCVLGRPGHWANKFLRVPEFYSPIRIFFLMPFQHDRASFFTMFSIRHKHVSLPRRS